MRLAIKYLIAFDVLKSTGVLAVDEQSPPRKLSISSYGFERNHEADQNGENLDQEEIKGTDSEDESGDFTGFFQFPVPADSSQTVSSEIKTTNSGTIFQFPLDEYTETTSIPVSSPVFTGEDVFRFPTKAPGGPPTNYFVLPNGETFHFPTGTPLAQENNEEPGTMKSPYPSIATFVDLNGILDRLASNESAPSIAPQSPQSEIHFPTGEHVPVESTTAPAYGRNSPTNNHLEPTLVSKADGSLSPEIHFSSHSWMTSVPAPADGAGDRSIETNMESLSPEIHFSSNFWMTESPGTTLDTSTQEGETSSTDMPTLFESLISSSPSSTISMNAIGPTQEPTKMHAANTKVADNVSPSPINTSSNNDGFSPAVQDNASLSPEIHFSANSWGVEETELLPSEQPTSSSSDLVLSSISVKNEESLSPMIHVAEGLLSNAQAKTGGSSSPSPEIQISLGATPAKLPSEALSKSNPKASYPSVPSSIGKNLSPEIHFFVESSNTSEPSTGTSSSASSSSLPAESKLNARAPSPSPETVSPEVHFSSKYWMSSPSSSNAPVAKRLSPTFRPSQSPTLADSSPPTPPIDNENVESHFFAFDTIPLDPSDSVAGLSISNSDLEAEPMDPNAHVFVFPTMPPEEAEPTMATVGAATASPMTVVSTEVSSSDNYVHLTPGIFVSVRDATKTQSPTSMAPTAVSGTLSSGFRTPSLSPIRPIPTAVKNRPSSLASGHPSAAPTSDLPSAMPSVPTLTFLESLLLPTQSETTGEFISPEDPKTISKAATKNGQR